MNTEDEILAELKRIRELLERIEVNTRPVINITGHKIDFNVEPSVTLKTNLVRIFNGIGRDPNLTGT